MAAGALSFDDTDYAFALGFAFHHLAKTCINL
jgi:hypothetical protein